MDINSIKIGTIGKFHIKQESKTNIFSKTKVTTEYDLSGVIVALPDAYDDYYIIDELGKLKSFRRHQLMSVSSIRISKELRTKFAFIAKKYAELLKLEEEKEKISETISDIRLSIKANQEEIARISGFCSQEEFRQRIQKLGYQVVGSHCDGKSVKVMLQQSNKGERYSSPYEFPFLYRRYDGSCIVKEEQASKEYKAYLQKNAPKINMNLAKLAESVSQEISVGDKYIYALTKYWIPLKNGYTTQDVDRLITIINNNSK